MASQICGKLWKPWPGQLKQLQTKGHEFEKVKDYLHGMPHDVITISNLDSDESDVDVTKSSESCEDEVFLKGNHEDTHEDSMSSYIEKSGIPHMNKFDVMKSVLMEMIASVWTCQM